MVEKHAESAMPSQKWPHRIREIIRKRPVRYFFCAATATAVDIGTLFVLTQWVGIWYWYSAAVSYILGMFTNFGLSRSLAFSDVKGQWTSQLRRFSMVAALGLALNQILIYVFVTGLHLWFILGKVVATFLVFGFSYVGHKTFSFTGKGKKTVLTNER